MPWTCPKLDIESECHKNDIETELHVKKRHQNERHPMGHTEARSEVELDRSEEGRYER